MTARPIRLATMSARAAPAPTIDDNQNIPAGIILMLVGFVLFSANDTLGKWLAGTYAPGQILLIRNTASIVVLAPFIMKSGLRPLFALERPWLQLLRLAFATTEVFFFYWAVAGLPLADTMTYYLAGPIYVTVLAAFVLKEQVGWRRWSAVAVGFVGVLIAMQPSSGVFNVHVLIAFIGSLLYSGFLVVTRRLRNTPDLTLATWHVVAGLIVGAIVSPFHWVPITHNIDFVLLALLGITGLMAIMAVNRSLRLAPASIVVPYQYTMIVWAVLFGYLVFGDIPSWRVLVGATIIVGAGLYIFFREQIVVKPETSQIAPGP